MGCFEHSLGLKREIVNLTFVAHFLCTPGKTEFSLIMQSVGLSAPKHVLTRSWCSFSQNQQEPIQAFFSMHWEKAYPVPHCLS